MQEKRALHRKPRSGRFGGERFQIGGKRDIDCRHAGEMGENRFILIDLQIVTRAVALMGAHDRREGGHLRPAHDKFRGADIAEQAGVTTNIGMVIGIAHEAG